MLYDVSQLSDLTRVSKVTIYAKLKLKEIIPYIVKKQGKTYVNEEGFKLIKNSLNIDLNSPNDKASEEAAVSIDEAPLINLNDDLINILKDEINFLISEIDVKNKQLDNKDELFRNMQVLLKEKEDKKLLEEHCKNLDDKLIKLKEEMSEKENNDKKQEGWFKFFRMKFK